jgi:hypothetical protein
VGKNMITTIMLEMIQNTANSTTKYLRMFDLYSLKKGKHTSFGKWSFNILCWAALVMDAHRNRLSK